MSAARIKLVSVNIERALHLDRVMQFIEQEKPDVLCVQELREPDTARFVEIFKPVSHQFASMLHHPSEGEPAIVGIGLFSKLPVQNFSARYYVGDAKHPAIHDPESVARGEQMNCVLLSGDIEKDGNIFRIATTHFTWSPRGEATSLQLSRIPKLLGLLESSGEFILCGDFNAPRGGEIFSMLAEKYKDNIPPQYQTSIDINLHRAGKDRPQELSDKMVDGLFSTPSYRVSDVALHSGVSDHMAITATIEKGEVA